MKEHIIFESGNIQAPGAQCKELTAIFARLTQLSTFVEGWDFGAGAAICKNVVQEAKCIAAAIAHKYPDTFKFSATPTTEGGVRLTFSINDDFIDLIMYPGKLYDLVHEKGIGANYDIIDEKEHIRLSYFFSYLHATLCNLSGRSTSKNIVSRNAGFKAIVSKIIKEASPYLSVYVQRPQAGQSARIYESSIHLQSKFRPYTA